MWGISEKSKSKIKRGKEFVTIEFKNFMDGNPRRVTMAQIGEANESTVCRWCMMYALALGVCGCMTMMLTSWFTYF